MAFPFTPAFSINIAAGLTSMSYKKFIMAASIAKIAIVYFWGYVGSTFIQSMTDPGVLLKLSIIIIFAFLLNFIKLIYKTLYNPYIKLWRYFFSDRMKYT